jgi:dTDP-4-dehydrorhamnose reductase
MKVVVTGSTGQLGAALLRTLDDYQVVGLGGRGQDVSRAAIADHIAQIKPDVVIHAAAWTNVDGCARDPAEAYRINALGTQNVALGCQRAGAAMVYVSTNEVFDGDKPTPYLEFDAPHAINPYGASKLAGESYVQHLLEKFYIVRTSWLYARGGEKFPDKIIAAANKREDNKLYVVTDEIGNPTYAPDLAQAIARLIPTRHFGVYHLVNEGACSRFDWAAQILEQAGLDDIALTPITLDQYKRPSTPPKNGALLNFAAANALEIKLRPWQEALADYFRGRNS